MLVLRTNRAAGLLLRPSQARILSPHAVQFSSDGGGQASFGLTKDQQEFRLVAEDFARKELLPFAAQWDSTKHFPVDKLRAAAQLGFGGILVGEDVGELRLSTSAS